MPRLLLLRHGQSTWNAQERWQGWADPPLSPLGRRQAEAAARWLANGDDGFGRVVSSDLVRAASTAEIVADALGAGPVAIDPGLRERDVGDWTGLTVDEIGRKWPEDLKAWRARRLVATPGGEHETALVARVLASLARAATGPDAVVVTHGGAIRAMERRFGAEACTLGNLCGRWIEVDEAGPRLGAAVAAPGAGE